MKKNACGMVGFKDGGRDYLFVCGGAGMLCSANDPEATYIPWKENPNFGWTNETHVFELDTSKPHPFMSSHTLYLLIYLLPQRRGAPPL